MKKQTGAALIVVLSLLTVSLMVGLSSMQSSQIDERLAGNYKASAEAQMNAEHAASTLFADIKDPAKSVNKVSQDDVEVYVWGSDGLRWAVFKNFATSDSFEDSCLSPSVNQKEIACYMELPDNFQEEGLPSGDYIVAFGAIDDSDVAESQPVFVKIKSGGVISAAEAALSCVGEKCSFVSGSGKSGPAIDGTDRYEEGMTQGSHKPDENPDGKDLAAIMMPDVDSPPSNGGSGNSGGNKDKGGVVGQELYTPEEYESYESRMDDLWADAQDRINSDIDNALSMAKSNADGFFYAGPGETVTPETSSGVVVIEGGTLDLGGKDKFSGLVILTSGTDEDGDVVYGKISSSGTSTIVGAVLGKDFSYGGNGNPSIFYSSEAIAEYVGRSEAGGGGLPKLRVGADLFLMLRYNNQLNGNKDLFPFSNHS